jgi:hypothetical protein
MSQDGKRVEEVVVRVNSQHLKHLLKEAIVSYPAVSLDTKNIALTQPCRLLYHYKDEIKQHGDKFEAGTEAAAHYNVLLNYMQSEFGETIREADNLREKGIMSYAHLWTLFRLGSIVFGRVYGQTRAYRLTGCTYVYGERPRLVFNLRHVDFDGKRFGTLFATLAIPAFLGDVAISKLNVVPREFFPALEQVEKRLVARGRRFEQYASMQFARHSAIAIEHIQHKQRRT